MRWNERQQAMLREMGIRLWLPPECDAQEEGQTASPAAEPPVHRRSADPAPAATPMPARADWIVVAEAPDGDDRDGETYSGRAGQLFDNMLRAVGRTRGEAPPGRRVHAIQVPRGAPEDHPPGAGELAHSQAWLRREIERVRPRLVIALGRSAAQGLLQTEEPFGRLRGRVHRWQGLPLVVTFAPPYLLRHPQDKAGAWDDLCLALQTVNDSSPG